MRVQVRKLVDRMRMRMEIARRMRVRVAFMLMLMLVFVLAIMIMIMIVCLLPRCHRRRARRASRAMAMLMPVSMAVRVRMTALEQTDMQRQRCAEIDTGHWMADADGGRRGKGTYVMVMPAHREHAKQVHPEPQGADEQQLARVHLRRIQPGRQQASKRSRCARQLGFFAKEWRVWLGQLSSSRGADGWRDVTHRRWIASKMMKSEIRMRKMPLANPESVSMRP